MNGRRAKSLRAAFLAKYGRTPEKTKWNPSFKPDGKQTGWSVTQSEWRMLKQEWKDLRRNGE